MFKIAICEEEPYAADHLERLLRESVQVAAGQPVLKFIDPFALTAHIEKIKGQLDIIFLGIAPDQERRIDAAAQISEKYPHIQMIFVTGYIEYATVMTDTRPVYFLTKPVEAGALAKAMDAVQNVLLREPSQVISINIRGYTTAISARDTLYIENSKHVVSIHGHSGTHIIHARLKELADCLPPVFCYCHRSFIVNLDQVRYMNKKSFYLTSGQAIPIGRTKYERVRKQFIEWSGKIML